MNTLVVEDEGTSRLILLALLGGYGHVDSAVNGREAVAHFRSALERKEPYDLVCMDIMMPDMDGREALRQLRAIEKDRGIEDLEGVKIVMTTALSDSDNILGSFQERCDSYLVKPIEPEKLRQVLIDLNLLALEEA